jgi:hypothetical protein
MNAVFLLIGGLIPHPIYYYSAAGYDLFIAMVLYIAWPFTRFKVVLMCLCLISIFINFLGLAIYENFMEPTKYDLLFVIYYAIALVIIATRMHHGDRRWGRRIQRDDFHCPETNTESKQ